MNKVAAALALKFLLCVSAAPAFLLLSSGVSDFAFAATAQKKPADKNAKAKKKDAALPKEIRAWSFARPNGVPTLTYGVLNGEAAITFSCQPETNLMRVVTQIGSRGIKPGDGTPVKLSNGNVRLEFSGTAFAGQAKDAVDISGATKIDQKFFGLFRAGDTVLLDIPGRKRGLPVKGATQSAEAFEKACVVR